MYMIVSTKVTTMAEYQCPLYKKAYNLKTIPKTNYILSRIQDNLSDFLSVPTGAI